VAEPARLAAAAVLIAVLALLWVFPIVLFSHPETNEAIWLSNLEMLLLLAELAGLVAVLVIRREHATVMRIALGIFLLGVAADFVIGLVAFGNMSNDRFLPLLFFPVPFGLAGLVTLVVGLALGGMRRPELLRGAGYGLGAAGVVGAWILLRGSRDWLLAPYGFDILVLILVIGAGVVVLSGNVRKPAAGG
jgi:hypothetical protein